MIKEKKSVKMLAATPLALKMCTNAGYLGHGSLEVMGTVKKLAAAPLASKMCTHADCLGHGSLEGIGLPPWPIDVGKELRSLLRS